jgi:SAM-dependent methyltransferase
MRSGSQVDDIYLILGKYHLWIQELKLQLIKYGTDHPLDIRCGDGFFTKRFFSSRCEYVGAIDVDEKAINISNKENSAPNITYYLLNAVNEPFPNNNYDVIVWDGAVGHFSPNDSLIILDKSVKNLFPHGIFVKVMVRPGSLLLWSMIMALAYP